MGTYFLTRHSLGNDFALLLLIALAAPFMLFGLYEKNGQPLEKILKNIIRVRLLAPAADLTRPTTGLPLWSGRHAMKRRYKRAVRSGFDMDILPPDLVTFGKGSPETFGGFAEP